MRTPLAANALSPIVLGHDKFDDLLVLVKKHNITAIYGHTDSLVFRAMKVLSENGLSCSQ